MNRSERPKFRAYQEVTEQSPKWLKLVIGIVIIGGLVAAAVFGR